MAKEFDIYLRSHLTQCDLLVYSIPYREGISVTNRLILESALNSYLLYKFSAAQMESEVEAHIDKMIKVCVEKLSVGVEIGAEAEFESRAKLYFDNSPVIIDVRSAEMVGHAFNEAESEMVVAVAPLVTQIGSSAGRGDLPILADAEISETMKNSLLRLKNTVVSKATIDQVNQLDYITADAPISANAALQNLCYQLTFDASVAVELTSLVLGTEIRHSLGVWYNRIALDSKVTGTSAQKFIAAQTIAKIMQKATETLIKAIHPEDSSAVIAVSDVDAGIMRYRLLHELDDLFLADIDDMAFEELDYVIL